MTHIKLLLITLFFGQVAWAAKPVLANIDLAKALGRPIVKERADLGVALIFATDEDMERLSRMAHERGHCGGFELVPDIVADTEGSLVILSTRQIDSLFKSLEDAKKNSNKIKMFAQENPLPLIDYDAGVDTIVQSVDPAQLLSGIEWLQGFGGRYHNSETPNVHVAALYDYLHELGTASGLNYEVHVIEHRNTPQHSLMFRLVGAERPTETVILGGHLDSINQRFFGNKNDAPGADDNASGSASLIEALKAILAAGIQPQRTVEFMWYAAEEVGLVGSAEIAEQYLRDARDVIGVLQLDMTLHPGSGEFVIASMSDYTSPWLRDILEQLNANYIHARIVRDSCGYGCSDHASWHRRGYPALMPFEATMSRMNQLIHTPQDVINERSNVNHAAKFSQIAVAFALTLGNSELREPAFR